MRIRWTGDGGREVMVEVDRVVEQVDFPRMEWRDLPRELALKLNEQNEGWELEAPKKAAKTRAKNEE